jgi:predicted ATPase
MATDGDVQLALTTDQMRTREQLSAIQRAQLQGEQIAVRLARLAEYRRREQTAEALRAARATLAKIEMDVARREATGGSASRVIEALRSAADDLVSNRVEALTPLLVRMYSRVDPHPGFQTVELLSHMWRGRGRLDLRLRDSVADIESRAPHVVLSSSQLNALALSVFLTFNLGIPRPPLGAVILDDPLQSLDEINLLGVVDLLRRLKGERQVIVSTHDRKFAELLTRKLRPVGPEESLIVVRLQDWERHGPQVEPATLEGDTQPWRLAHTA